MTQSKNNKKLVIFDFDGVLAPTIDFCFKLHKDFNLDLTWEKFQSFCNGNFNDGIMKAVNDKSHVIRNDFYDRYREEINKLKILEELQRTIIKLNEYYILSIVSSTQTAYIVEFLKKEKMITYFSEVWGSDVHNDKTVKINNLISKYSVSSLDVILITDSLGDILDANKCGIKSIGVTWGIHNKDTLEKGRPNVIIKDPKELLGVVINMLK